MQLRSSLTPGLSPTAAIQNCCPCSLWQDHLQQNHSRPRPYLTFLKRVSVAGVLPKRPVSLAAWTSQYSAQPMLSLDDTNSNSRLFPGTRSLQHYWASLCYSSIPGVQVCFDVSCPSNNLLSQSGRLGVTVKHVLDSYSYRKNFFLLSIKDQVFAPPSVLQSIKDPASCL